MIAMRRDLILCGLFVIVAILWPMVSGMRYSVTQTTFFFIWATIVVQWNLVFGVGGIFSLAQVALFAIGAYVTAMLGYYFGTSMLLAMPVGAIMAVLASVILGLACLRLHGPYVALLTLCVSQVIFVLIVNDTDCFTNPPAGCMPLMGGVRGFSRFGDLGFRDWLGSGFYIGNYYVGLALLTAAILFSSYIARWDWPFALCETIPFMLLPAGSTASAINYGYSASLPSSPALPGLFMQSIPVWSGQLYFPFTTCFSCFR
jgi:branched-chain amino acid transport system permease protein